MVDHIEDIEFENVGNIDSDDSNSNDSIDAFEEAEIHIQNILNADGDEDPDEEAALSDDSGCNSNQSEHPEDLVKRVVPNAQINGLNLSTIHCMIKF